MGIHQGHRERRKQRFSQSGLDSFEDHEVLELLLYYAIPQKDTNPIAHRLIQQFGSLAGVLEAPQEELMEINGIGQHAAVLLKLIPQLSRRYLMSRQEKNICIDTAEKAKELFRPRFVGEQDEVVYLLSLDSALRVKRCDLLSRGGANNVEISLRRIAECALSNHAANAILAHNHPSGVALPSLEDRYMTERAMALLKEMDICLCDHIIVAGEDCLSMVENGDFPGRG